MDYEDVEGIVLVTSHDRRENHAFIDEVAGINIRGQIHQFVEFCPSGKCPVGNHVDIGDVPGGDVIAVIGFVIPKNRDFVMDVGVTRGEPFEHRVQNGPLDFRARGIPMGDADGAFLPIVFVNRAGLVVFLQDRFQLAFLDGSGNFSPPLGVGLTSSSEGEYEFAHPVAKSVSKPALSKKSLFGFMVVLLLHPYSRI